MTQPPRRVFVNGRRPVAALRAHDVFVEAAGFVAGSKLVADGGTTSSHGN